MDEFWALGAAEWSLLVGEVVRPRDPDMTRADLLQLLNGVSRGDEPK
ncbi:phage tail assembly chaperone [Parvularcula sp. LCG005]